ncbi:MAG: cytochrome c biogenesis protein CcsA [Coriobacteriales bacterium]|jgi:c-type cytochrome biogenesis protein CcmF|nr:cytochrome c biogenesis protein CcsA [Coriobacteriales bacterium]
MAIFGQFVQSLALVVAATSVILLLVGALSKDHARGLVKQGTLSKAQAALGGGSLRGHRATRIGLILCFITALLLTVCCGVLLYGFFFYDFSLFYVAANRSYSGWLYQLAGLWGGREGSLLFWVWLISLFVSIVAALHLRAPSRLDAAACMVCQAVMVLFLGVLVFSTTNNPFVPLDPGFLNPDGSVSERLGMNLLLKHWAMALHPPTLFVGYAGFTVPLGYALGTLLVKDASATWIKRCNAIAVFSWLMLGIGIALGALWAYVVLGWGGYWGWDPVENASLLPWLVGVAMLHTFTIYRLRGAFKRWAVFCACLAFSFVILSTFITRSGIVQSVHAFSGDDVSLWLILGLIVLSLALGVVGLVIRRKEFGSGDDIESFASRDAAFYFNNVIMVAAAVLVAYMTLSSALPSWLPFGGQVLPAGTYENIARPVGIVYCAILALCPLLAWQKTRGKQFRRKLLPAAVVALVVFGLLLWNYLTNLLPNYNATILAGGEAAEKLAAFGPAFYYHTLGIAALVVASLIVGSSAMMLKRLVLPTIDEFTDIYNEVSAARKAKEARESAMADESAADGDTDDADATDADAADDDAKDDADATLEREASSPIVDRPSRLRRVRSKLSLLGGLVTHLGIALCLVGLVGSNMYTHERVVTVPAREGSEFTFSGYTFKYLSFEDEALPDGNEVLLLHFAVFGQSGKQLGVVSPGMEKTTSSSGMERKLVSIYGTPLHDVVVTLKDVPVGSVIELTVKDNPFITVLWIGALMLVIGPVIACFARRGASSLASGDKDRDA